MSEKFLNVEIISPQQKVYEGKATIVDVPGKKSPFQILYNHAPLISTLDTGIVRVVDTDNKSNYFAISSGFVEISNNDISILAEEIATAENLNPQQINNEISNLKQELNNNPTNKEQILQKIKYNEIKLKVLSFVK